LIAHSEALPEQGFLLGYLTDKIWVIEGIVCGYRRETALSYGILSLEISPFNAFEILN
jgi:hypothetical protein